MCHLFSGQGFSGHYDEYFNLNTDTESLVYLMLANDMLHSSYPFMITVAEVYVHSLSVVSNVACAVFLFECMMIDLSVIDAITLGCIRNANIVSANRRGWNWI